MSELILPTLNACKAFGICRTNSDIEAKSKPNTYGFIEGPQTRMLFSSENFDFENKFYDTFNYKPQFSNTSDPVHTDLEKNVIDEVVLEFLKNKPTRITHRTEEGKVVHTEYKEQVKSDEVIQTIRIAPNTTDWLSFDHNHEWGAHGGLVQSIISALGSVAQSVESFMASWQNILGDETRARRIVKSEFTSEWQGTKNISFDIPFVLFTAGGSVEAFVRDIYEPIMRINQLIYPKRFTDKEIEEIRDDVRQQENESITDDIDPFGREESIYEKYPNMPTSTEEDSQRGSAEALSDLTNLVNLAMPGSRVAFLTPPSHVRVTHSSGLFRFARCGIVDFKYTYEGPWVKTGLDDEYFNKMQSDYSAIFGFPSFMSRGFPCIAKCSLTLTTLDPLYSDDWQEIYQNSDVVEISKQEKGGDGSSQVEVEDIVNMDKIDLNPERNQQIIEGFSGSFFD